MEKKVINRLENDVDFGLAFAVQNQPAVLIDNLKAVGFPEVETEEQAYETLKMLLRDDKDRFKEVFDGVQYDSQAKNSTSGYEELFQPNYVANSESVDFSSETSQQRITLSVIAGLLGGIGAIVGVLANSATPIDGEDITRSEEQLEADRIEKERLKKEAEDKERTRGFLIIGAIVISFFIIGAVVYNSQNKSKK